MVAKLKLRGIEYARHSRSELVGPNINKKNIFRDFKWWCGDGAILVVLELPSLMKKLRHSSNNEIEQQEVCGTLKYVVKAVNAVPTFIVLDDLFKKNCLMVPQN